MTFKYDGYHKDGSMCVFGYDTNGIRVAIFRGFPNFRNNMVTLYPKAILVPTRENIEKQKIAFTALKKI